MGLMVFEQLLTQNTQSSGGSANPLIMELIFVKLCSICPHYSNSCFFSLPSCGAEFISRFLISKSMNGLAPSYMSMSIYVT